MTKHDAILKDGLVSIVVPVYNAENFLSETIGYIQAQTYKDWELLLVDDCSTDKSREWIETKRKVDDRIKLVVQDKNSGAAKARNRGICEAQGRYLCFLDADDIWMPDKLSTQLEYIKEVQKTSNPQPNLSCFDLS